MQIYCSKMKKCIDSAAKDRKKMADRKSVV